MADAARASFGHWWDPEATSTDTRWNGPPKPSFSLPDLTFLDSGSTWTNGELLPDTYLARHLDDSLTGTHWPKTPVGSSRCRTGSVEEVREGTISGGFQGLSLGANTTPPSGVHVGSSSGVGGGYAPVSTLPPTWEDDWASGLPRRGDATWEGIAGSSSTPPTHAASTRGDLARSSSRGRRPSDSASLTTSTSATSIASLLGCTAQLPRRCASFVSLSHTGGGMPAPNSMMISSARLVLEELKRERGLLEPIREQVPRVWLMLSAEIHRVSKILRQNSAPSHLDSLPSVSSLTSLHSGHDRRASGSDLQSFFASEASIRHSASKGSFDNTPDDNELETFDGHERQLGNRRSNTRTTSITDPYEDRKAAAAAPNALYPREGKTIVRKRCRIQVPVDEFPDFNFVGRLLGPRGSTLRKLEKETGCKIMIRGRGSIRRDREQEVAGKPGWEHLFTEPLHVILDIEAEESQALQQLERAREAIELFLVPVPEELDTLKREQLRDLAILKKQRSLSQSDL